MKEEILKRLDALAAKLGVAANELWRVLLKQATVEAWQSVAWAVICGAVATALIYTSWTLARMADEESGKEPDEGRYVIYAWLCIFASIIFTISFFYHASCIVTPFLNPEYWALQQILSAAK